VDQLTGEMVMISISRTPICATSSAFRLMIDRTVSAATDGSWASHSIVTTASFSMSHRVVGLWAGNVCHPVGRHLRDRRGVGVFLAGQVICQDVLAVIAAAMASSTAAAWARWPTARSVCA